jgi:hypothetical protein
LKTEDAEEVCGQRGYVMEIEGNKQGREGSAVFGNGTEVHEVRKNVNIVIGFSGVAGHFYLKTTERYTFINLRN